MRKNKIKIKSKKQDTKNVISKKYQLITKVTAAKIYWFLSDSKRHQQSLFGFKWSLQCYEFIIYVH